METDNSLKLFDITRSKGDIILNEYFCFIQIPKTGTVSMVNECRKHKLVKKLPCYRHEGLAFIEQFLPSETFPVWSVVRNPFSQAVSYFFHRLRWKEISLDENLDIYENFGKYLKSDIDNVHMRQIDYIRSNRGIQVNIVKFEDRNIFQRLNEEYGLTLKNTKRNVGRYKGKRDEFINNIARFFHDDDVYNLIITSRKREFIEFGYSFNLDDIVI